MNTTTTTGRSLDAGSARLLRDAYANAHQGR